MQGRLILYLGAIVALLSLYSTLPRFDFLTNKAILVQGPLSQHPGYRGGGEAASGERREVFRMPVKLSDRPEHLVTSPAIESPEKLFKGLSIQAVVRLEPGVIRFEVKEAETLVEEMIIRVTHDYHLESMRIARPSLDDVFLHHTGRALRD